MLVHKLASFSATISSFFYGAKSSSDYGRSFATDAFFVKSSSHNTSQHTSDNILGDAISIYRHTPDVVISTFTQTVGFYIGSEHRDTFFPEIRCDFQKIFVQKPIADRFCRAGNSSSFNNVSATATAIHIDAIGCHAKAVSRLLNKHYLKTSANSPSCLAKDLVCVRLPNMFEMPTLYTCRNSVVHNILAYPLDARGQLDNATRRVSHHSGQNDAPKSYVKSSKQIVDSGSYKSTASNPKSIVWHSIDMKTSVSTKSAAHGSKKRSRNPLMAAFVSALITAIVLGLG